MSGRILIIDDADHLREVLKMTLEFKSYEVTMASNGQEGMEAARAGTFDLIFCDIDMPVMNGMDFVRKFRAELGAETPIVMLTAEDQSHINTALEAGANGALVKPFDPIMLLNEIEKYFT